MAFTDITVTGQYNNPDGTPAEGTATFLLTPQAMSNGDVVYQPKPIVATINSSGVLKDAAGTGALVLPANNDPGTLPIGTQYLVVEQTAGSANREYTVTLDYALPGATVDISTLMPNANPIFDGMGTDQWSTYITAQDLMDWMQIEAIDEQQVVTNMQRVCDMACAWAQTYCQRPLASTTFAERHDGWSGSDLILNKTPFLTLVLCTEYQSSGGTIVLPEATPETAGQSNAIQIDRSTSSIRRVFGGYSWPRTFFPGSRNISITYTAGYDPVPPDVWLATIEYASYWFRMTQQSRRNNIRGGSDPDQLDTQNGLWAGVPNRLKGLLDPYRVISIG